VFHLVVEVASGKKLATNKSGKKLADRGGTEPRLHTTIQERKGGDLHRREPGVHTLCETPSGTGKILGKNRINREKN